MSQVSTPSPRQAVDWPKLIEEVLHAPSLTAFHEGMLNLQCRIVAAEYGTLWTLDKDGQVTLEQAWPPTLKNAPENDPARSLMASAARTAAQRSSSLVMRIDRQGADRSPGVGAHVFSTLMRVQGRPTALSVVVADCRDASVIQSTLPMRELAASVYEVFATRQEATYRSMEADRVRRAMALLATSQEAQGFEGAAMNLVNEMARQFQCARVSLGWIKGRGVKLVAMSDTENLLRHSEQVSLIELAMAESLDQQQPLLYPPPSEEDEPMLAHAVLHAHRHLIQGSAAGHALSIPLRLRDQWLGVLTLERAGDTFTADQIAHLQLTADVTAPHLSDRHDNDRWLLGHALASFKKTMGYLVGPKHVLWKLAVIAVLVAIGYLAVASWPYKVSAPFVFEAQTKRILPAPFEARLDAVHVHPGDPVQAGQVLAELDVSELQLQLADARGRQRAAELRRAKGRAEGKEADAQLALADLQQISAQIALLEYRIQRAAITSPLDGYIVAGAWHDRIGSILKQGDNLFEVAPESDMVAVLHIDESDINMVQPGQTGLLASKADPQHKIGFTINRIVPMAGPVDNANVFEVRAKLDPVQDRLLAGTEGRAYVDVGDRPVRWMATRRVMDKIRLWMWW